MRYLLMIGGGDDAGPGSEELCGEAEVRAWVADMERRGAFQGGDILDDRATTVRVRGDEVLLFDGPFAETKEQIGGFCILECADLDEAVGLAARHPVARIGLIEVRPIR